MVIESYGESRVGFTHISLVVAFRELISTVCYPTVQSTHASDLDHVIKAIMHSIDILKLTNAVVHLHIILHPFSIIYQFKKSW